MINFNTNDKKFKFDKILTYLIYLKTILQSDNLN